jgi:DNA-directed RNA polymerase specialized sigma24 family protein
MYDKASIERLLPCLWDENKAIHGIPNELAPDHDMPKGQAPNPAHAGGHWVAVADMRRAWDKAGLDLQERQVLWLRYGLDSLWVEMASDLSIGEATVGRRLDRGINKLGLFLNGRPFDEEKEAA